MMTEDITNVSGKASGALQNAKDILKDVVQSLVDKIKEYKGNMFEIAIYAAVGVLIGFLLKKYLRYVLLLVLFIVSLVILEQFDLVQTNVNWIKVQELFNIQQTSNIFNATAMSSYVEWIRLNAVITASAVVGFLIGLKLG